MKSARTWYALITIACLQATSSVWTHHNMSAAFDLNQRSTVTGTLVKIDWRNPHTELSVDAKGDQGPSEKVQTWRFEGPSPSAFRNWNIARSDFSNALGKRVIVEASRARDGSFSGLLRTITLPDGKVVSLCPAYC